MPDMHDPHLIVEDTIEHFERLANERRNAQARPLFDLRRAKRLAADTVGNRADAGFESFGYPVAESPATNRRNRAKVGDGTLRVLNPHRRRNVRNAASTSSSVATLLRSASSIA